MSVWLRVGNENTGREKKKKPLLRRVVFISMGEYIKLVEREKEARSERSAHWEAETDLGALRKAQKSTEGG